METGRTTRAKVQSDARTDDRLLSQGGLDRQLAELCETIRACERQWRVDDHVDAAIKYGRHRA